MATLYRPKFTTYTLRDGSYRTPDGERVTKDTPGAVRKESRSKTWFGRYTDGAGQQHQVKLSESKETARRMLAKLAGDAQLAGVGIVDPFAEHRQRPLLSHLEDYRRVLEAGAVTRHYAGKTVSHCEAIIKGCGFAKIADLDPAAVVEFLGTLRQDGAAPRLPAGGWFDVPEAAALLGMLPDSLRQLIRKGPLPPPGADRGAEDGRLRLHRDTLAALLESRARGLGVRTSNDYLGSLKRFSKWLVKNGRAAADPLAHLSRLNARVDRRHQRRALDPALFARFVEATAAGKPFRGIGGLDRLVLYTLAANTGFRANELASLAPASFDLGATPPTVTVEAAFSKHRREDMQPLRADVAEMMRQYTKGRPRRAPLWPGKWAKNGAEMLRGDLAAAGVPYEEGGRYFDFHALRGQFITMLAAGGVHPKVAQELARHSTITLTMDYYTRLDVRDVAGALDKLPELPASKTEEESRRPA
jgi:integrase